MKIFDLDSPLMNVLNKMADLMWLNILTLICCIPIITAGAAFTSMHYVALKIVRNEESYITRSFFKSFKTNFRQATLIWLMILLIAAVLGGDYYIITKSGIQFSSVFPTCQIHSPMSNIINIKTHNNRKHNKYPPRLFAIR